MPKTNNVCTHDTAKNVILYFGFQNFRVNIRYYHQDLHNRVCTQQNAECLSQNEMNNLKTSTTPERRKYLCRLQLHDVLLITKQNLQTMKSQQIIPRDTP
jgi:hypothetical protein